MAIRKQGGLYFWNVGRIGGSFYVSKRKGGKVERAPMRVDWFGMAACVALVVAASVSLHPRAELRATTASGNVYVVGSGDTCADASLNAVYPTEAHKLECVQSFL